MSGWFANMKYSRKLLLAFGVIVLAGLVPFVIGLRALFIIRDALHAAAVEGAEIEELYAAQTDTFKLNMAQNTFLLTRAPAELEAGDRLLASVNRSIEALARVADSEDEVEEARGLQQAINDNHAVFRELATGADRQLDPAAVAALAERQRKASDQLRALADDARGEIEEALGDVERDADDDTQSTMFAGIGLGAGCMLFGIVMSLLFARGITRPISELRTVAEKISLGDTDVKVTTGRKDEIGQLADSFDRMVTAVRFLAMEVAEQDRSDRADGA